jgi:hypothetical protein
LREPRVPLCSIALREAAMTSAGRRVDSSPSWLAVLRTAALYFGRRTTRPALNVTVARIQAAGALLEARSAIDRARQLCRNNT